MEKNKHKIPLEERKKKRKTAPGVSGCKPPAIPHEEKKFDRLSETWKI